MVDQFEVMELHALEGRAQPDSMSITQDTFTPEVMRQSRWHGRFLERHHEIAYLRWHSVQWTPRLQLLLMVCSFFGLISFIVGIADTQGHGHQPAARAGRTDLDATPTVSSTRLFGIHVIKGSLLDFFKCVHVEPRRQEGSRREAATPGDLPRVARKKASS